jgi:hypothetical protein
LARAFIKQVKLPEPSVPSLVWLATDCLAKHWDALKSDALERLPKELHGSVAQAVRQQARNGVRKQEGVTPPSFRDVCFSCLEFLSAHPSGLAELQARVFEMLLPSNTWRARFVIPSRPSSQGIDGGLVGLTT